MNRSPKKFSCFPTTLRITWKWLAPSSLSTLHRRPSRAVKRNILRKLTQKIRQAYLSCEKSPAHFDDPVPSDLSGTALNPQPSNDLWPR